MSYTNYPRSKSSHEKIANQAQQNKRRQKAVIPHLTPSLRRGWFESIVRKICRSIFVHVSFSVLDRIFVQTPLAVFCISLRD